MSGLRFAAPRRPPAGLPAGLASLSRTAVMGVLNVTPDSFSDGGRYLGTGEALAHAERMAAEGADIIDVGGESTRPGAHRIDAEQERSRVLPVVEAMGPPGVPGSIDTMHPAPARAGVEPGAVLVNDVSGGLADPAMLPTVAELQVPYAVMHWRGHSDRMGRLTHYDDVVADVAGHLRARVAAAIAAGVGADRIVVDPGLGFAKEPRHNWTLLADLEAVVPDGMPVLVGASRKSFLGALLPGADGTPRPVGQRGAASVAISTLAAAAGAWCVRVHEVRANADAVAVAAAWRAAAQAAQHEGAREAWHPVPPTVQEALR